MKKTIYLMIAGAALFLNACSNPAENIEVINTKASLTPSFNFNRLGLRVIASSINKKQRTMSILYGNKAGLNAVGTGAKEISDGGVLTLVTWNQQEDAHWYGANIPGDLLSVELIKTKKNNNQVLFDYSRFEGKNLVLNTDTTGQSKRLKFILGQRPSVMP
ncbi:MAG TPA: hypothetical protein VK671_13785 [Mucilaginibacter sp.]|jgi:hypothetical protein|nr:hypothetical protein [Mucilaginibacter sp.]